MDIIIKMIKTRTLELFSAGFVISFTSDRRLELRALSYTT